MESLSEHPEDPHASHPDAEVMQVRTWREGDEFVAALDVFNVHAFGDTRQAAVRDLMDYLPEYLEMLDDEGDNLAPWLTQERDALRAFLSRHHG